MVLFKNLSGIIRKSRENLSLEDFENLKVVLRKKRTETRERIQEANADPIAEIIYRLKSNEPLREDDIRILRLWIVGDADSYLREENNFQDWLTELERLEGILKGYEDRDLSPDELFRLQGILEDTMRVSDDIENFVRKKQRIEQFEASMKEDTPEGRQFLAKVLASRALSSKT